MHRTTNDTIVAYIIEKSRLGTEEYNRLIQQAQQNNLQTYKTFSYQEQKLTISYYKK